MRLRELVIFCDDASCVKKSLCNVVCLSTIFYVFAPALVLLRSLAEGGIQVGALARHYYKTKYSSFGYHYIETKDKAEALHQTKEAMQQNNVVIAEAAFEWKGWFVIRGLVIYSVPTEQ